jgi:hypothetical protein
VVVSHFAFSPLLSRRVVYAVRPCAVQDATEQALAEAKQRGIAGRDVTPFLLKRINELTGGESLRSNIALIKNNAATGARTAALVSKLHATAHGRVIVVGGSNQDLIGRPTQGVTLQVGTSNPGQLIRSWGGVARNVAEVLGRLNARPCLVSVVGTASSVRCVRRFSHAFVFVLQGVTRQEAACWPIAKRLAWRRVW